MKLLGLALLLTTSVAVAEPSASAAASLQQVKGPNAVKKDDPVSWPGVDPFEFGCFLEKELGAQFGDYNCAALSSGMPKSMDRSGPAFPTEKSAGIKAGIIDVNLSWEHMRLQEVSLRLDKKMTDAQLKKFLGVKSFTHPRANVELIKTSTCGGKTCVLIQNKKRDTSTIKSH